MKFSEQVVQAVANVRASGPTVDLTDRDNVIRNLVFMYHVIKASENLLAVAANCTTAGDPLHEYFVAHLEEERGHEKWLHDDLISAGVDLASTSVSRVAVETAGSMYYLIYHVDPAALLGYMVALECIPVPIETVEALEALHGESLLRTLRFHAIHDLDHGPDVLAAIDALTPDRHPIVAQSAIQTAIYLSSASLHI